MMAYFEEPIDLQGTHDQFVLEISLQQFSKSGQDKRMKNASGS